MDRSNRDVRFYSESGHRRLTVSFGLLAALGEGQKSESASSDALGRGGLAQHLKAVVLSCRYGAADNKDPEPT